MIKITEMIYNRYTFWIHKVNYSKFPSIYGFLYLKNNGELTIGNNVIIRTKMSANPIGNDFKTVFGTMKTERSGT